MKFLKLFTSKHLYYISFPIGNLKLQRVLMKKKGTISIALLTALFVSGCATITTTGPLSLDENTYVMSRRGGAFSSRKVPLLVEVFTEASNFCLGLGKVMKVKITHENRGPFTLANFPEATVTFWCVSTSPQE